MSVVRPELTADSHGFSRSPSKRAGQRHSDLSTARTMSGVLVPGPLLLHTICTSVAPYLHQWWLKRHSDCLDNVRFPTLRGWEHVPHPLLRTRQTRGNSIPSSPGLHMVSTWLSQSLKSWRAESDWGVAMRPIRVTGEKDAFTLRRVDRVRSPRVC
jgi:hypothetical protein